MSILKIYDNPATVIKKLAEYICLIAKESIKARGEFTFVLSGGGSPGKLYELLASDEYKNKIDWKKTYFFFGDERFVPAGDVQRNSLMAEKKLFKPLEIKEFQIFKVDTSGTPEEAAQKYNEAIAAHFKTIPVEFDLNLLGLGSNSHTASLFPNTDVLAETEALVKSIFVEEVGMHRITMSAPLINQSKNIVFLVFGKDKAQAVYHILEDVNGSSSMFPARLITKNRKVKWYLDSDAASLLKK